VDDDGLVEVLHAAADAVAAALAKVEDWAPTTDRGTPHTQYAIDLVADAPVLDILLGNGLGVLSEESGLHHPEREITVVVDPVDGSTNASRRLPWYATSLCAVDADGPRAALVVNQAGGERFGAVRGGGATVDGRPLRPTACTDLGDAVVGLCGFPARHLGWRQFRSLGAAALDLCAVAAGRLDGYVDVTPGIHGPWDYLGALLVCTEAGVPVADGDGRPLVHLDHGARRAPVAAATPGLLDALVDARRTAVGGP
jgi:fructose-1,6-bisphosphatase/inositol monophosphatase family enzyme